MDLLSQIIKGFPAVSSGIGELQRNNLWDLNFIIIIITIAKELHPAFV